VALRIRININTEWEATMSNQDLDYAAIRRNVEKNVERQKWLYRILFFVMHVLFFLGTMFTVWGIVATNEQLRAILFTNQSAASLVVILPTIMWALVILFHVASLFLESSIGVKSLRQRMLMREVGEDILRKGDVDEELSEKPKRRAALEIEHLLSADRGELLPLDEDESRERRGNHASHS
jgi:hypothetical protein